MYWVKQNHNRLMNELSLLSERINSQLVNLIQIILSFKLVNIDKINQNGS